MGKSTPNISIARWHLPGSGFDGQPPDIRGSLQSLLRYKLCRLFSLPCERQLGLGHRQQLGPQLEINTLAPLAFKGVILVKTQVQRTDHDR